MSLLHALSRLALFGSRSTQPQEDSSKLFEGDQLREDGKVAVLFTVDWCPFCRGFEGSWRDWPSPEGVKKLRVDISDESNPLWETFKVDIVPTVAYFSGGKLVWRADGRPGVGLKKSDLDGLSAAVSK